MSGPENDAAATFIPRRSLTGSRRLGNLLPEVNQDFRDVDFDRTDFVTRTAETCDRATASAIACCGVRTLGRCDRLRVATGLTIDRTRSTRAQRMQSSARARRRPVRSSACQQHDVKLFRAIRRRRAVERVMRIHAFAVADRASSCRKTSRSVNDGITFSMPANVMSSRGSMTHIRPLPSDSTTRPIRSRQ